MTAEAAMAIGMAAAHVLRREGARRRIVIGKDTRLSGYIFETALTAGICSMGVDVLLVGPLPTPGIAFTTRSMRADAGIVISASHNPYQDNGIKIFSASGFKISDAIEGEIEDLVLSGRYHTLLPPGDQIGKARRIDDAIGRYIVFCKNTFPESMTLDGLRVVLDCANGATYRVAPTVFTELGAEVIAIHDSPNGRNINENCGSQHPEDLAAAVVKHKAHFGFAFDGDGDRVLAVDEKGNFLNGDSILCICAKAMKDAGLLTENKVILTPMSNLGLRLAFDRMGIHYQDAAVGDRYVLELMQKTGSAIGGEQSGHIIFLDHHTTGDGIVAALQLAAASIRNGKQLSSLGNLFQPAPQVLINIDVREKVPLETLPDVQSVITQAENKLGTKGRVLVRYSGTQPMCRVMVEAADPQTTRETADAIANIIRQRLGV
jgi:phosphoglucosamine mutase